MVYPIDAHGKRLLWVGERRTVETQLRFFRWLGQECSAVLRLLVPAGSLLLDLPEMAAALGPFDAGRLVFPWRHLDPEIDALQAAVLGDRHGGGVRGRCRAEIFDAVWRLAGLGSRHDYAHPAEAAGGVPHLLEPWFCCAEPPAVTLGVPAAALI